MKIQWSNLIKGVCINGCNEPLINEGEMVYCKFCDFKIRLSKYQDLILGKKSKSYKKIKNKFSKIKNYHDRMNVGIEAQRLERESNLRRMKQKTVEKPL